MPSYKVELLVTTCTEVEIVAKDIDDLKEMLRVEVDMITRCGSDLIDWEYEIIEDQNQCNRLTN